jgi:hypothetical protein
MIRKYEIENTDETYLRIWQKINFGKEILEPNFFKNIEIDNSQNSYKLSVYQFDSNNRLFYLGKNLYLVTSDESIYNYLDTGRVVSLYNVHYQSNSSFIYIFNDLNITDEEIKSFEEYDSKNSLDLKELMMIDNYKVNLIFKEDLEIIQKKLEEFKVEREQEEKSDEEKSLKMKQEEKKLIDFIRQYDKMTLLEDNQAIIKDNYFIDKELGIKIEFKDKVVKIFDKDDLVTENRYNSRYSNQEIGFIDISYRNFLDKIERVYRLGKYETDLEEKLQILNKKLLNFKIYSYDTETKAEVFLKEIKIENIINDKGKRRFKINGVKMPKQKMSNALDFISRGIIERITNLEKYLEQIRLYSGTQLQLLEGKTVEIHLNGVRIPLHFNIIAEDKENWQISIDNFLIKRNYTEVKNAFYHLSGGGLGAISQICSFLQSGKELEDILINKIREYTEKRKLAEERAEKLFAEFLDTNKTKIFKKEGGYIIKGKLKNYLIKMKNEEDVGVWSYPGNEYVCINEKTKTGQYLCKFDKLLQFCLCMLNDGGLREEIHTIH